MVPKSAGQGSNQGYSPVAERAILTFLLAAVAIGLGDAAPRVLLDLWSPILLKRIEVVKVL